jgi:hypothetical protein
MGYLGLQFGPLIPEGLRSKGRQGLKIMLFGQEKMWQMAEIVSLFDRFLSQLSGPES